VLGLLTNLAFEPFEVGCNQVNVSSECVVIELDLANREHHLGPIRMRQYPNRVRHYGPRRQRHVVIKNAKAISFDESNLHLTHRRIHKQPVTIPDNFSPCKTGRPLRKITDIRCVLVHGIRRRRDDSAYVLTPHNGIMRRIWLTIKGTALLVRNTFRCSFCRRP
jgi:hypothetical protein